MLGLDAFLEFQQGIVVFFGLFTKPVELVFNLLYSLLFFNSLEISILDSLILLSEFVLLDYYPLKLWT